MKPYYQDNFVTIYHGNAFELIPNIEADILLTDPQYGIGFNTQTKRSRCHVGLNFAKDTKHLKRDPAWRSLKNGDNTKFDAKPFLRFNEIIIWGGNNFADQLPASRGWLVWDKLREKTPTCFGDCELAWTNINMPIRIWRQLWRGIVREGEENLAITSKLHPCQKPASLMRWCLKFCKGQIVVDPFMGSGTTLRAAKDLGRQVIGIDIEEHYCEVAAKRMAQECLKLNQ